MTGNGQREDGYRRAIFHVPSDEESSFTAALSKRSGIDHLQHRRVRFLSREMTVTIPDEVPDEAIIVMSPTMDSSDALLEFMLLTDALARAGVQSMTCVFQYLPYSRSDRAGRLGEPLGARVVISMLESTPVDRFFIFDLHAQAVLGFFSKRVIWAPSLRMLSDCVPTEESEVVVSPDRGRYDECVELSRIRGSAFDLLIKVRRDHSGASELAAGARTKLDGRSVLLYDDEIWTGQTSGNVIRSFYDAGVTAVHYMSTYDFSSDPVRLRLLDEIGVKSVTTTNLARPGDPGLHEGYRVVDVSELVVDRLHLGRDGGRVPASAGRGGGGSWS